MSESRSNYSISLNDYEESTPTELHSTTYDNSNELDSNIHQRIHQYISDYQKKFNCYFLENQLDEDEKTLLRRIKLFFLQHKVRSMFKTTLKSNALDGFEGGQWEQVFDRLLQKGYLSLAFSSQAQEIVCIGSI